MSEDTVEVKLARLEGRLEAAEERHKRIADDMHAIRKHMEGIRKHMDENFVDIKTFTPFAKVGYIIAGSLVLSIMAALSGVIFKGQ